MKHAVFDKMRIWIKKKNGPPENVKIVPKTLGYN